MNDLNDLLKHELGDLLAAERIFLKGLKQMERQTSNTMVAERLRQHADETEDHIDNLSRAFEALGFDAEAQRCDAAIGLDAERTNFLDVNPSEEILEAFNLGAGLRVEHYEIAGYRSAIALARQTGNSECERYLQRNLDQEIAMARFIEEHASSALRSLGGELTNTDSMRAHPRGSTAADRSARTKDLRDTNDDLDVRGSELL